MAEEEMPSLQFRAITQVELDLAGSSATSVPAVPFQTALKEPVAEQDMLVKLNEALDMHFKHMLHIILTNNGKHFDTIETAIRDLENGALSKLHVGIDGPLQNIERRSTASTHAKHLGPGGDISQKLTRHRPQQGDTEDRSIRRQHSLDSDTTMHPSSRRQASSARHATVKRSLERPRSAPARMAESAAIPAHGDAAKKIAQAYTSSPGRWQASPDSELLAPSLSQPRSSNASMHQETPRLKCLPTQNSEVPGTVDISIMDDAFNNEKVDLQLPRRLQNRPLCREKTTANIRSGASSRSKKKSPTRRLSPIRNRRHSTPSQLCTLPPPPSLEASAGCEALRDDKSNASRGSKPKEPMQRCGLSADAKISEIERFQTDMIMRTCGILDNCGHSSPEVILSGPSDIANDNHDPCKSQESCVMSTRSSVRRDSSSRIGSLESLRQQNDYSLALSELTSEGSHRCDKRSILSGNQGWGEPGKAEVLVPTEPVLNNEASDEDQWSDVSTVKSRLQCLPWIIFRVCGIIPWRQRSPISRCYSLMTFAIASAVVVYPTFRIAQGKVESTHMCILPLTVASLLGALSLRHSFTMQLFTQFPGPLELYSMKHGFAKEFLRGSIHHFVIMLILWVSASLIRGVDEVFILNGSTRSTDNDPWMFVCFLIGSLLFVVSLYCQLHVICMLGMMVDRYCIKLFPGPTSCQRVLDWNLIQALLRQIAGAFDFCFMMTQIGACAAILLAAMQLLFMERLDIDGERGKTFLIPLLLPTVLLAFGAFVVFFKAASVSEKCSRVAPLVNSMTFDDQKDALDSKRMNTVHFISSSGAGFYIQEVRITASMAMKLMSMTGLCAFALVTKLTADMNGDSA